MFSFTHLCNEVMENYDEQQIRHLKHIVLCNESSVTFSVKRFYLLNESSFIILSSTGIFVLRQSLDVHLSYEFSVHLDY